MDVVAARSRRVRQPRQNGKYFVIPSPTGPAEGGDVEVSAKGGGGLKTDLLPRPGTAQRRASKGSGSHDQSPLWGIQPSISQFLSGSAQ